MSISYARPPVGPPLEQTLRELNEACREVVARYVSTLIVDRRLTSGERIPQLDIAAAVGVSRAPVREALICLTQQGLLTYRPRRGYFVAPLDGAILRDAYVLAGLVLGFAAGGLASGGCPVPGLDDCVSRAERALTTDDRGAAVAEFHDAVVAQARSASLGILASGLPRWLHLFSGRLVDAVDLQARAIADIHNAITNSDAQRARARYEQLMRCVGDVVSTSFETPGVQAAAGSSIPC